MSAVVFLETVKRMECCSHGEVYPALAAGGSVRINICKRCGKIIDQKKIGERVSFYLS